jgi:hypothetical protein
MKPAVLGTAMVLALATLASRLEGQRPAAQSPASPAPAQRPATPAQRPATPAQRPATPAAAPRPAAPAPAAPARAGTPAQARPAPGQPSDAVPDTVTKIDYRREVFSYQGGSRDPFQSLVTSSDVRPTIGDLRVVSIVYDARGNSVAIVREANNPRPHRLRRGDQIGRLRVVQIRPYEVVFQVEEFGFERQETLTLTRPEAYR